MGEGVVIDLKFLREQLDYSPDSGEFTWKVPGKGRGDGAAAGCIAAHGYVLIGLGGRLHLAHRLAWLHFYGVEPGRYLDHIDRNRSNNRIGNLRQATHQQNMANSPPRHTSVSGIKGVSWCAATSKWRATITVDGKQRSLGRHSCIEDAAKAYATAAIAEHGAYAATELGVTFYDLES